MATVNMPSQTGCHVHSGSGSCSRFLPKGEGGMGAHRRDPPVKVQVGKNHKRGGREDRETKGTKICKRVVVGGSDCIEPTRTVKDSYVYEALLVINCGLN